MISMRQHMHRRQVKRLYFHERELSDLLKNAKQDEVFLQSIQGLGKMSDSQVAESYILYISKVMPASINEIILDPV